MLLLAGGAAAPAADEAGAAHGFPAEMELLDGRVIPLFTGYAVEEEDVEGYIVTLFDVLEYPADPPADPKILPLELLLPPRLREEKASNPEVELAGLPHREDDGCCCCIAGDVTPLPLLLPNRERMSALFFLDGAAALAPLSEVVLFEVAGEDRSRSKKPPPLTWAVFLPVCCVAGAATALG